MKQQFQLPALPYAYDALEPHIDEATMRVHHDKHHQAYTDKLNIAIDNHPELFEESIEEILADVSAIPEDIRTAVINNGGGYYHHNLLWEMMAPEGSAPMSESLRMKIEATFSSVDALQQQLMDAAKGVFGSGWAWLVKDVNGMLSIMQTKNQDSPVSQGLVPLLGVDVWEHAYYLKFQQDRASYLDNWWKVINWKTVEDRLQ